MIECTDSYIYYKKKNKKSYKFIFIAFLLVSVFLIVYFYYNKVICDQIFKICGDYAYSCSSDCVNSAVLISLNGNISYDDLIKVEKNSNGEITLITTDSYKVNSINRQVSNNTSVLLKEKLSKGVPIPSFALSGISFLSGYGSVINLKTINTVSVVCDFFSTFKSVGINQTLHSLYLEVESTVNIQVPFNNKKEVCVTKILLSESVLVGKVPEIYLNGGLKS